MAGDESADGNFPLFQRASSAHSLGQGVFRLTRDFLPVAEARVQQFDRSPQQTSFRNDYNSDFIEIAIPARLHGLPSEGGHVRIAALVVQSQIDGTFVVDDGFVGTSFKREGGSGWHLGGLRVDLPIDPKRPLPILSVARNDPGKMELRWPSSFGVEWKLEESKSLSDPYRASDSEPTLKVGIWAVQIALDERDSVTRYYRLRRTEP